MRTSIQPLAADNTFHQAFVAAAGGNLPRQTCLVFSGRPYSFPLTRKRESEMSSCLNVAIDVYSAGGNGIGRSQDRFLGQARLDQLLLDKLPAHYIKLPLKRRRCDTLDKASVQLEIEGMTGREICVTALKATDLPLSARNGILWPKATKLQLRFELLRSSAHSEECVESASSSVQTMSNGRIHWPEDETIHLCLPIVDAEVDLPSIAAMRVVLWRTGTPSIKIGTAEWPIQAVTNTVSKFDLQSKDKSDSITLHVQNAQGIRQGQVRFQVRIRTAGAKVVTRTAFDAVPEDGRSTKSDPESAMPAENNSCYVLNQTALHSCNVRWKNIGGQSKNAAATLEISDAKLLCEPLKLTVFNKNPSNQEEFVGEGYCDLRDVVSASMKADPKCRFNVRLNRESPDQHKILHFTAWLEETHYLSVGIYCIRIYGISMDEHHDLQVSLSLAENTVTTESLASIAPHWDTHVGLRLPATIRCLKNQNLHIGLWAIQKELPANLLIATATMSIKQLLFAKDKNIPLRITAPLEPRSRREVRAGIVSLTLLFEGSEHCQINSRESDALTQSIIRPVPHLRASTVTLQFRELTVRDLPKDEVAGCQLYIRIRIGRNTVETTLTRDPDGSRVWSNEVLPIQTDLDEVTGGLIEIDVHEFDRAHSDVLLGSASLNMTPTFLFKCSERLRVSLGISEKEDTTDGTKSRFAAKLRRFGCEACGLITFELRISMEMIDSFPPDEAWQAVPSQRRSVSQQPKAEVGYGIKRKPRSTSSLQKISRSTSQPLTLGETFDFATRRINETRNSWKPARIAETEDPLQLAAVHPLCEQEDNNEVDQTYNVHGDADGCGNMPLQLGGALRVCTVPPGMDDETEYPQEVVPSLKVATQDGRESETEFLIGKYDDAAETFKSRRQCRRLHPRDRNELRVCVLRAKGLSTERSRHYHATKSRQLQAKEQTMYKSEDPGFLPNAFVTLRVLGEDDCQVSTVPSVQRSADPEWQERFVLRAMDPISDDVSSCRLVLEITVRNNNNASPNDFLGWSLTTVTDTS